MSLQHLGVIHLVNMISGKNQQKFRIVLVNEIDILRYGIRSSPVDVESRLRFLTGRQHKNAAVLRVKSPASASCDITVEQNRFILRQNAHNVDAAVRAVTEREVDDAVLSAI